ncbi:TIGR03668 family PPOX class F420-dependent oxidoreductase [Streptomonospora wellingtoniae]|uniref:TIGR03668 family PPOX class F420-dependent oxidoreductase n=1 Tax=Streptomonospora wellingtoniae TaxID=3075544 RepID=A0ABU2KNH8_9ACTN|nr:TIGR03668 family PPOX class F420-dependent oxidoreductase [Streptomonospora sp. DSM 45055]MDT0300798.1 TIGR03668 family PPOX class F420-dependent oxidoreductase [Streptomonospora sp. DSM 45055]
MRWNARQCREHFARARVARLATVDADGLPHLVPVTFALIAGGEGDADTVAFAVDDKPKRTTSLRRLANIAADPRVCLLADEYSDDWSGLWWVRADGLARIVDPGTDSQNAPPEHRTAVRRLQERYAQYRDAPPAGPVVLIEVTRWSGWSSG